jgi:hypothetical protein
MKTTKVRHLLLALLALVLVFSASPQAAFASSDTFDVTVAHNINGRSLGLSKDLPVTIYIQKDGELLTAIPNFRFGDRISTSLPAGQYLITVVSDEAGPLPSMTVGPVDLTGGLSLFLNARLSANKTPIVAVVVQ